jgi:hypothetical protein
MIDITIQSIWASQRLTGKDSYFSEWHVDTFDGWDGPEVHSDLQTITGLTGASPGEWQYGARPMTIKGMCYSRTEAGMWAARNRLLMSTKTANVFEFSIPITAYDPRKYGAEHTQAINRGGGLMDTLVVSSGTTRTSPKITIVGPMNNINIQNNQDNSRTFYLANIPSGFTAEIDFYYHIIWGNGILRYDLIRPAASWWSIVPGNNHLSLVDVTGAGSLSIYWVDAYI